jgi:GNAT superfamily N-acetyltransferase
MIPLGRIVARHLQASATPLPASFPKSEIGLMTAEEFLHARNPGGKSHDRDAYDTDLFQMNHESPEFLGSSGSYGDEVHVDRFSGGFRVTEDDKMVAVIHNGTAYYDKPHLKGRIPRSVFNRQEKNIDLEIKAFKQVKYLSEVMPLISPIAKRNVENFPVLLQHIIVGGESMTVRAEKTPITGKQVTLAILNADSLKVAQASDEWGATLFMVAQEYRGKGLGKLIGQFWYDLNPESQSGGFTPAGEQNALALWRARVREFSAWGWYTALIREKRLMPARVQEILAGVGERLKVQKPPATEQVKQTGDTLVFADGITFVVYDSAFLQEPDEKFIHGYGFLRDADPVGVFFYAIDYDRPFAKVVTRVGLQMVRDNGERLYDGDKGYHDLMEVEGIPGVAREGDYLTITQDLFPLKAAVQKEKRLRKVGDPYDEKYNQLVEMAESKWK